MINQLKPNEGSRQKRKRVGRGMSSGHGKTSGRGHKGQLARGSVRPGFEGGQLPLFQSLPKRGFKNVNHKVFAIINLKDLNNFEENTVVTPELLIQEKFIKKVNDGVKVLANGNLEKKLTVKAHAFSDRAKELIEKAGGTVEVI